MPANGSANIGVVGLAVMGSNLARNLASREGNTVAVFNRSPERTRTLVGEHPEAGFVSSEGYDEFVASLAKPRTAIIMVQAGKGTDAVISELAARFEPGDIIVDGGNANFHDTIRREKEISPSGIHFVGAGISGGEEGALNGPSIMPGGSTQSYETLGPILSSIAAIAEGEPCVTHVGTDGAGHFVKMVHNGIEYADMQLIAEAYDLVRRGAARAPPRSPRSSRRGTPANSSAISSRSRPRCCARSTPTQAAARSTSCSTRPARRAPAPGPCRTRSTSVCRSGIAAAVFARSVSSRSARRARHRSPPRPVHGVDGRAPTPTRSSTPCGRPLRVEGGRLLAGLRRDHRRGRAVRLGHHKGAVAKIWRAGCIIRAEFLNRIVEAYAGTPTCRPS